MKKSASKLGNAVVLMRTETHFLHKTLNFSVFIKFCNHGKNPGFLNCRQISKVKEKTKLFIFLILYVVYLKTSESSSKYLQRTCETYSNAYDLLISSDGVGEVLLF